MNVQHDERERDSLLFRISCDANAVLKWTRSI